MSTERPHPDPAGPPPRPTPADGGPADSNTHPPAVPGDAWRRRLAVVLLVAAAALYVRDLAASRARSQAALDVRRSVAEPVAELRIGLTPEGRSIPMLLRCPPALATNLLHAIGRAEPVRAPKGAQHASHFEIQIVYTNATARALRAFRLQDQPDALFVGIKDPLLRPGEPRPAEWRVARPARLADGGEAVAPLLDAFRQLNAELPPDAELLESLSNAVSRATAEGGGVPHADPASPTADAP